MRTNTHVQCLHPRTSLLLSKLTSFSCLEPEFERDPLPITPLVSRGAEGASSMPTLRAEVSTMEDEELPAVCECLCVFVCVCVCVCVCVRVCVVYE